MTALVAEVDLHPIRTLRRTGSISSHVILELRDDAGNVGWGELSDLDCYRTHMPSLEALREAVLRMVVGYDPRLINALHARLRQNMPFYWRDSNAYPPFTVPGQLGAAMEMACFDLAGKALGVPVHVLLGGKLRDEVPITYPLFGLTSARGAEQIMEDLNALLLQGVFRFRYYVSDLAGDVEILRLLAARDDVELTAVDFGSRFRAKDALAFMRRLSVEVPLVEGIALPGDLRGMAWARARLDCDVSEHVSSTSQAIHLIEAGAVDVFNICVVSGGLQLAQNLAHVADAAGLKIIVGTTQELGLGTAAGMHFAAVLPAIEHACDPAGPLLYSQDVLSEPLAYSRGPSFSVPSGPGLGVDVDRRQLELLKGPLVEWDDAAHGPNYVPR